MSNTNSFLPVPADFSAAIRALRSLLTRRRSLSEMSHEEFMAGWTAIAFIAPRLHPDESGHDEGGWPVGWRCIADEAFRRAAADDLADDELYPYAASHRALCVA
jgi:hypothetical protein